MKRLRRTPSYGAVIIEENESGHAVLLIQAHHTWSFPKGHQEEGEAPEETARREILEETGIRAGIDTSFSRTVDSSLPDEKRSVTFFLGSCPEGMPEPVPQPDEVNGAQWTPVHEALTKITFEPDRLVLEDALRHLGIPF